MMIRFVFMVWIVPWEGSGNKVSRRWQWQGQWQVAALVDTVGGELLSWQCDRIVQTAPNFNHGGCGCCILLFLVKCP
jgi:hypothetical protein